MLLPSRRPVLIIAAVAVLLMAVLGVLVAGDHGPTGFDQAALDTVKQHLSYRALRVLKAPTNPVLLICLLTVVALVGFGQRRADLAVLAAVGPGLAVLLSSFVLKPIFGRRYYGGYLAYPSGHTTALTSTILVILIAIGLFGKPLLTWVASVLAFAVLVAGVIGLVGLDYHYLTDTFGGFCVAGATVSVLASVLDGGWLSRFAALRGGGPASESAGVGDRQHGHGR